MEERARERGGANWGLAVAKRGDGGAHRIGSGKEEIKKVSGEGVRRSRAGVGEKEGGRRGRTREVEG